MARVLWFAETLEPLLEGRALEAPAMARMMEGVLAGECGDAELAALLVALRMKGETGEELAAAAGVLRARCVPFATGRDDVLDTCGTGGDGLGTFNISTATALVVAGCGVPVVKHGNRAISGNTGSADVLAVLGVEASGEPATARRCLEGAGMAFCMAPLYHPALKQASEVRRRLGVRTIFNALGPLCNPARAPYQLLGVGRPEWQRPMAEALARLGVRQAFLVHAADGLDEVSLGAPTLVLRVRGGEVEEFRWRAEDFGLPPSPVERLRVRDAAESAATIRRVLEGEPGPALNAVLANAAAALLAAERTDRLKDGVEAASVAIRSGKAAGVLESLVRLAGPGGG